MRPASIAPRAAWQAAPKIGVRRRAHPQPFRSRHFDDLETVGERGRERLLAVDVLARFQRRERHFRVGLRDGEIENRVDVLAGEKIADCERLDAELPGLPPRRLGQEVGAGDEFNVAKQRRVGEVDAGNLAAADDADAKGHDALAKPRIAAALARAKRVKSLGLSCSAIIVSAPAATHSAHSADQSRTPAPTSAQPSSTVVLAGRRDVLDVNQRYAAAIALDPCARVLAGALHPGEVRLPVEVFAEDIFEPDPAFGERRELEIVVMPDKAQALFGEMTFLLSKKCAERGPARAVARPPLGGEVGRDDRRRFLARERRAATLLRIAGDRVEIEVRADGGKARSSRAGGACARDRR